MVVRKDADKVKIIGNPIEYRNESVQFDLLGEMLIGNAPRVGHYGFPQLKQENFIPTDRVKSFNYLLSTPDIENWWFHCFCDDYQFQRLWTNFDRYLPLLKSCSGLISTDFSLYRDYTDDVLIWNCYRNRAMAYAMQAAGCNVIPTAGFGGEHTWSWCFDGLPKQSTVAVTTNGTLSDPEAKRLFVGGIDALVNTVAPSAIVVCGRYPEWLNSKYPGVRIIPIHSFSQQWATRRCA